MCRVPLARYTYARIRDDVYLLKSSYGTYDCAPLSQLIIHEAARTVLHDDVAEASADFETGEIGEYSRKRARLADDEL